MNKVFSVLLLSLGLANVATAATPAPVKNETNKALAWIKKHPKLATTAALALVGAGAGATVYFTRNTEFVKPKLETISNAAKSAKDAVVAAPGKAWDKTKAGAQYAWDTTKAHYIVVPTCVVAVLAAALATYDLTKDADKSVIKKMVNKLSGKVSKQEEAKKVATA